MFKKILLVFVVALSAVLFVACDDEKDPVVEERTYVADGEFTAFRWEIHSNNGPQVSSVTVTIEDDEVVGYYIDVIQNTKTVVPATETEAEKVTYAFNDKTKKELGYGYRMHGQRDKSEADYKAYLKEEGLLEWFEQAKLIEDFFLAEGPDKLTVDEGNYITNVEGGVTIKDGGYSTLAKEALELAKEGTAKAWIPSGNSVVFATAKVDKDGKFTELELDTIQGSVKDGKYVWNEKTKQELGYDYRMHNGAKDLSEADYKKKLEDEGLLEWFEQAKIITDGVLANGVSSLELTDGKLDSAEGKTYAGVTITASAYKDVLTKLYDKFK